MNLLFNIKKVARLIIPYSIYHSLFRIKSAIKAKKNIKLTINYSNKLDLIKRKDKIVLVFIIYMPEVFSSFQTIYESAVENEKFIAYIVTQPHISNQQGVQGQNPAFEYLKTIYLNVINAYENGKWFDLKSLKPDYVFYTRPYMTHYYSEYSPKVVRQYAKVCFHQYSYDMDKTADFYEVYNYPFLSNVTFVFNSAPSSAKRVKKMICGSGVYPQVLCLGFTRFDLIQRDRCQTVHHDRKTILWIPRWTAQKKQGKKQGHFFLYMNSFMDFAEAHKDIDFIIRPHPLMFANFLNLGLCTQEWIDSFYEKCNDLGNVSIDTDKDYFPSLKQADIMLADYSALVVEFFVMGKPIIYCDDASTFNEEAKRMDSVLYHAKKWCDIKQKIIDLLAGNDELKIERLQEIPVMMQDCDVGKRIINFIEQDYFNR